MQSGNKHNAYLIDVSRYQNTITWSRVAQAKIHGTFPVQGALIRASQGMTVDPRFQANITGATTHHLYRGAYHSVVPQGTSASAIQSSAADQAHLFFTTVNQQKGWEGQCLNPGVDIEVNPEGLSPAQYLQWLQHFLSTLEGLLGSSWPLKPMLYLNQNKWQSLLGKTQTLTSYPLWVAQWGVNQPQSFGGWTQWQCWQWSSPGSLSGISGNVDYDEWATSHLPQSVAASSSQTPQQPASGSTSSGANQTGKSLLDAWETATQDLVTWVRDQLL